MSIRGIGDGYAFSRLLWLLVGTVIVPTILLSLFGVAAIRNQGAAVLQELDRLRAERLELGARSVLREVRAVEAGARDRATACSGQGGASSADYGGCALGVVGTQAAWAWTSGQDAPPELVALGVSAEVGRQDSVVWVLPVDGSPPIAVVAGPGGRDPGTTFAWRLDPGAIQLQLDALTNERLPEHVALHLTESVQGVAPLDAFVSSLGAPERAVVDLPRPLSGWRLVLDDAEEPSRRTLTRNAWLYPATLVVLVALVLIGAVVTLGSATREIRLSRLQTDFVSNVSHELRTPLTSIRLFVETLQSGRLQDPARTAECLDLLAQETDRLSRLIERVLDWARMEGGRRVYEFEAVGAKDLAYEALRALRSHRMLVEDPDPIEVDIPDDLPALRVDRDAIVEALLNLLHNAVKHTAQPRRIALTARAKGADARWIGLSVADNGPGIPKRDRKRIFEKFYQIDARLAAPAQGTVDRGSGLGLAIVRAVARAHGGRVDLDSELGKGSRFTLWLPAVEAAG